MSGEPNAATIHCPHTVVTVVAVSVSVSGRPKEGQEGVHLASVHATIVISIGDAAQQGTVLVGAAPAPRLDHRRRRRCQHERQERLHSLFRVSSLDYPLR